MKAFSLAAILVLAAPPLKADDLAQHPEVLAQIQVLDEWIKTQMEYRELPGLAIGIVHDQTVVWSKAYGWADVAGKTPLAPGSAFRIASHSKLFTSIAILQLRDAGKLRLDDPVVTYLPWFKIDDRHSGDPPIQIWHLLTHSAGLPRESNHPSWTELEFPTFDQVRSTIAEQQTAYPTETKWKYSNLGLTLAGLIVEKVSGRRYEEYVEREIMAPLRMTSSSVGIPSDEHRAHLAIGYGRLIPGRDSRETMPFVDAKVFDPATGLSSTIEDMMRFLSWQMRLRAGSGTEVLKASTLREMQRVHWLQDDWASGTGLGFSITHTPARDLIGHGGSYPGYRTATMLSPKENVGVVVFANSDDGDPTRYLRKAFEWVAPTIVRVTRPDPRHTDPDPGWAKYVGTYRSRSGDTKVLIVNKQLILLSPLSEDPLSSKTVLVPAGVNTFRMEGEGGGPHGELARFEVDRDGAVTRLFTGVNYSVRVK